MNVEQTGKRKDKRQQLINEAIIRKSRLIIKSPIFMIVVIFHPNLVKVQGGSPCGMSNKITQRRRPRYNLEVIRRLSCVMLSHIWDTVTPRASDTHRQRSVSCTNACDRVVRMSINWSKQKWNVKKKKKIPMHFNGYQADFHESRAGPVPPPAPQRTAEVDDNILPSCTICHFCFEV